MKLSVNVTLVHQMICAIFDAFHQKKDVSMLLLSCVSYLDNNLTVFPTNPQISDLSHIWKMHDPLKKNAEYLNAYK